MNRRRLTNEDVYDIGVIDSDETVLNQQFTVKGLKQLTFELSVGRQAGIPIWKARAKGVRPFLIKSCNRNHKASLNDMLQSEWECRKVYFGERSYDCIIFIRKKGVRQVRRQIDINKESEETGHISKALKDIKGSEGVRENERSKAVGGKNMKIKRKNTQRTNEYQAEQTLNIELEQKENNVFHESVIQDAAREKQTRDTRYSIEDSSSSDEAASLESNEERKQDFNEVIAQYAPWKVGTPESIAFGESIKGLDECVEVFSILFKSHGDRLHLDWKKCNSFKGLETEVRQFTRSFVEWRIDGSNSSFLSNRWQTLGKVHNDKMFFYEASFDLLYRYSLDVAQLCDILEFVPPRESHYFQQLFFNIETRSWYAITKENWLENQFTGLLQVRDKKKNYANDMFARLPWTMAVYQCLFRRFGHEMNSSVIKEIITKACSVEQSHIMGLIISSTEFETCWSKIFEIVKKQDLFKLLKGTNLKDSFNTYCQLLGFINSSKHRVLDEFVQFPIQDEKCEMIHRKLLVALLIQVNNFNLNLVMASKCLAGMESSDSIHILRQRILHPLIEKVYTSVTPTERAMEKFKFELAGHDSDTLRQLEAYYRLYHVINITAETHVVKAIEIASKENIEVLMSKLAKQGGFEKDIAMVHNSQHVNIEDIFRIVSVVNAMRQEDSKLSARSSQELILLYLLLVKQSSSKGILAQVYTGEGKTCLTAMLAAFWALKGKKVDVITSSGELTEPHLNQMKSFYDACELTTMVLEEGMSDREAAAASNIVYGTVNSFIGHKLRCREIFSEADQSRIQQVVIIDEVDNILFDRKSALVQLTSSETKVLMPLLYPILFEIYFKVKEEFLSLELAEKFDELPLVEQDKFILSEIKKSFTTDEIDLAAHRDIDVWCTGHKNIKLGFREPFNQLITDLPIFLKDYALHKFELWIENCYKAIFYFARDVSYLRDKTMNKNIKIDSQNTGVLMRNTELSNGLEQFLAMKENSQLLPCSLTASFSGIAQYFNNYETMFGLTGTLGTEDTKAFLRETYNVDTVSIPSHFEDLVRKEARSETVRSFYRCFEFPAIILKNKEAWMNSIVLSTFNQTVLGRPVLVFLESLREINAIKKKLESFYEQKEEEVSVLRYDSVNKLANGTIQHNHVILATNIAGRGTDLEMSPSVKRLGGLHVCLTYLPDSERVETQCVGRTARKGEMGTAQLIILSYEDASIDDLREARNKARAQELVEAKDTLARYKQAQYFDAKRNAFVKDRTEFVGNTMEMKRSLERLKQEWNEYKEEADTMDSIEKWEFLNYYTEGEISSEVRRAFILDEVIKFKRVPYNSVCLDYIKQQWAFWMDKNCLSQYRRGDTNVKDEYSRILQYFHGILQNGLVESQHYVFLAREAFRILASNVHENIILSILAELFDETGFGDQVDNILERESQSDHFKDRYAGLVLYYYAGYQLKRILQDSSPAPQAIEKINKILLVSERYIKSDIIDFFERLKSRIFSSGLVYKNLDAIQQVFTNFSKNIAGMRARLKRCSKSGTMALHSFNTSNIFEIYDVDIKKSNVSKIMLNQVTVHCNAFGHFGEFFIHSYDDIPEPIPRQIIPKGIAFLDYIKYFIPGLSNSNSKKEEGVTILRIRITKKQRTVFNVQKLGENTEVKALFDLYLEWQTNSNKLSKRVARIALLRKLTADGITKQENMKKIQAELEDQVYKNSEYIPELESEINKRKQQINKKIEEIREERMVMLKNVMSTILEAFENKNDILMDFFRLDCYYKDVLYQEALRNYFMNLLRKRTSRTYKELYGIRVKNEQIDEIKILKYAEVVYKDFEILFERYREHWKTIQNKIDFIDPEIEKKATKKYEMFVFFVTRVFVEANNSSGMKTSQKELEKKVKELEKLHSRLAKRFKGALKKNKLDLTVCPCCQEVASLYNRIRAVSACFRIVLVIYQNSQRVAILEVEEPVGIVRVSLMTDENGKNVWEVKGRRNNCLIAILAREHTVYDKNVLLENAKQRKNMVGVKKDKEQGKSLFIKGSKQENSLIRAKETLTKSEIEKPQKLLWHPDDAVIGHQSYLRVGYGDLPTICLLEKECELLSGYHNC